VEPAVDQAAQELVRARHGISASRAPGPRAAPRGGHEAIRPSSLEWPPERARPALRGAGHRDLGRLYALVWDRFIESRMTTACWLERSGARDRVAPWDPARLDESALLGMLAARGVGRPSTYATIGESLVVKGYLTREGQALTLTWLGRRVVAWLERTFPGTLDADFTVGLEAQLDEVEAGNLPWRSAVVAAWTPLERALAPVAD
jgi:DNA topoisomerase-1